MIHALTIMKNSAKSIWIDRGMFVSDLLIATSVPFLIQVLIWKFIYSHQSGPIHGYQFHELMFYYIYAILLGRFNNSYDLIVNFAQAIQEGTAESYFLKPLNMAYFELYKFIGAGFLYLVPILIAAVSWFFVTLGKTTQDIPSSALESIFYYAGVLILIGLSQVLCFYIGWSVAQLCFWFVRSDFLANMTLLASAFFGGELLPSNFWPPMLRPLLTYNPFSFLIARPSELLIHRNTDYLISSFELCGFYILLFAGISQVLFHCGRRRYESIGG